MKHCLIVDDSAVVRKVAKRIMEGLDLRTSEAEDGEEALASCRVVMPDAVVVDATMPGMDGFDFVRALRRMPGGDGPRILYCTTENDVALIARAMHAGATDFIMKPFDKATMVSKLEEIGIV